MSQTVFTPEQQQIYEKVLKFAHRYMPKIMEPLGEVTPDSNINIDGFESLNAAVAGSVIMYQINYKNMQ